MVKLVDMPDLGSGAARRVGSSPIIRTEKASEKSEAFLFLEWIKIHPYNLFRSSGTLCKIPEE